MEPSSIPLEIICSFPNLYELLDLISRAGWQMVSHGLKIKEVYCHHLFTPISFRTYGILSWNTKGSNIGLFYGNFFFFIDPQKKVSQSGLD